MLIGAESYPKLFRKLSTKNEHMSDSNCTGGIADVAGVMLVNLSDFGNDLDALIGHSFTWVEYLKIWVYLVTILVAVVGNAGVILTVALNRSLRTTINCYLTNLAVADAIISMFCMWVHLVKHLFDWYILGPFMCKIEGFAQMTALTCSVLTLSAISCDRFTAIMYPFHARITKQRTGGVLASVWLISAAVASPLLMYTTPYTVQWTDVRLTYCGESWPQRVVFDEATGVCVARSASKQLYYTAVTVALFFVPVFVMSSAYALILHALWRERHPGEANANNTLLYTRAKRKVVKLVCVVLIVFVLCWMPFQVIVLFSQFRDNGLHSQPLPSWFSPASFWCTYLAYANSALNPIIYGGMTPTLRQGLANVLRCGPKAGYPRRWSLHSRMTLTTGQNAGSPCRSARLYHRASNSATSSTALLLTRQKPTPPVTRCSSSRKGSTFATDV
ncbi:QRFP-like peptide receptor [Ixodes scapularis]|uniref:QRFP-like peptide receptor n=1 Tax=Ixodes scapularis TaxID=6945 RepID=UPI001C37F93E|nr:QRFP-like peptide receptor [Ixodes scapularis]